MCRSLPVWMWEELTSAKTAPYLIALPTNFSVDPLSSGEYSFNNPSSLWSDERRASVYAITISRLGAVAKVRTVVFAENRDSREPLCFPMTTASVLFYQIYADWLVLTTDSKR